jgi:uncharacterized protein (TIGR02599 family)
MIRGLTKARGGPCRRVDSFSLVEMLVSIAILSILMIILLGMTFSLSTLWQAGQAHNERRTNAQAIFERMTRDLQQVSVPSTRSGNPSLFNTTSLQFVINPSGVSSNYEFPQALFWQAPVWQAQVSQATNGNLAVVGYFVQWVNGAPCLSRVVINPSTYSIYSNPATSAWINDNSLATNAPATAASNYSGLMAGNVLGLWVQALDGLGNPIQQGSTLQGEAFDSRLGYASTNFLYSPTNVAGNPVLVLTNAPCALPAAVQIAIVVIDSSTARRLTGTEKPTTNSLTGNFWPDIQSFYTNLAPLIRKGAEIQTTTVSIANGPR